MTKKKKIIHILDTMQTLFGEYPTTELFYETPFQCLIAVMMSAQTTDKQVNKVTKKLFQIISGPQDILEMGGEIFAQQIKTIGLWKGKAKNIFATARLLLEQSIIYQDDTASTSAVTIFPQDRVYKDAHDVYIHHGYSIPDTIKDMIALPGVGIKTAKVVLYVLYRQRWVAVDTHVHRVMNRLGVVKTKQPEQTSKQLETLIPDAYKDIAHHTIIYFGRYLCLARNPQCGTCPLSDICVYYKKHQKK